MTKTANKVFIEFTPTQVEKLVGMLSIQDKIRLVQKLENESRKQRWDEVISKIRRRFKQNPISQKEIDRICEETRQQIYAKRIKSGN